MSGKTSSGEARLTKDLDHPMQGFDVIVVEDIVDTGITLTYFLQLLQQRKPKSLRIAALLDKPSRRQAARCMWIMWASRCRTSSWSATGWIMRRTIATCRTSASWKAKEWPQMNANERESLIHNVVGAIYEVSNVLGAGFLEKVYERALVRELRARGMKAETQVPCPIAYKGDCVGEYFIDILVEDYLPIELKCVDHLANEHLAQCLNYLRGNGQEYCSSGQLSKAKVEWKRVVLGL